MLLATYFLLQESKNIFELQAQERMTILKNVFDLIGIDETKEVIAENKREVTAIIKARSDQTQYDDKFSLGLETLKKSWNKVVDILQYYMIDDPRFIDWKSFFFDQTVLQ